MTICQLGAEWHDPTKIPVEEIAEEWRTQSTKGRYESAMWREAGLQEPNAGKAQEGQSSSQPITDVSIDSSFEPSVKAITCSPAQPHGVATDASSSEIVSMEH